MGADTFITKARGKTAQEAFTAARERARYEYGHSGYTGTIAEKVDFLRIPMPAGIAPRAYAEELIEKDDARISSKRGPAGCLQISADEWLFFGWARS